MKPEVRIFLLAPEPDPENRPTALTPSQHRTCPNPWYDRKEEKRSKCRCVTNLYIRKQYEYMKQNGLFRFP